MSDVHKPQPSLTWDSLPASSPTRTPKLQRVFAAEGNQLTCPLTDGRQDNTTPLTPHTEGKRFVTRPESKKE